MYMMYRTLKHLNVMPMRGICFGLCRLRSCDLHACIPTKGTRTIPSPQVEADKEVWERSHGAPHVQIATEPSERNMATMRSRFHVL